MLLSNTASPVERKCQTTLVLEVGSSDWFSFPLFSKHRYFTIKSTFGLPSTKALATTLVIKEVLIKAKHLT
ncbi:MAG: hypothetical protein ACR2LR_23010 [Hassallia sp.]